MKLARQWPAQCYARAPLPIRDHLVNRQNGVGSGNAVALLDDQLGDARSAQCAFNRDPAGGEIHLHFGSRIVA